MKIAIAAAVGVAALLALAVLPSNTLTEVEVGGKKVRVYEEGSLKSLISPHVDKIRVLEVGKAKFPGIVGIGTGFQALEGEKALLFVTSQNHEDLVHFFDLKTEADIQVPRGIATSFGDLLGTKTGRSDHAFALSPTSYLLINEGYSKTNYFVLDLEKKSISNYAGTNAVPERQH